MAMVSRYDEPFGSLAGWLTEWCFARLLARLLVGQSLEVVLGWVGCSLYVRV